jgi:hypothetical protein
VRFVIGVVSVLGAAVAGVLCALSALGGEPRTALILGAVAAVELAIAVWALGPYVLDLLFSRREDF